MPPFLDDEQMSAKDVFQTKSIASLRIHVERAIGRVKHYRILCGIIPATLWEIVEELVYVCAMLSNFSPPLVG